MRLPSRTCSTGCGRIATHGSRCYLCQKASQYQRPERPSPSLRGYDKTHNSLRVQCFQRDAWRCVDCGWEPQIVKDCREYGLDEPSVDVVLKELKLSYNRGERHLHGDHDLPIEQRPDLKSDLDNYRTRCNKCHAAKTMKEQNVTLRRLWNAL
jgi:hypothetical protein